jgi:hypothetical protein
MFRDEQNGTGTVVPRNVLDSAADEVIGELSLRSLKARSRTLNVSSTPVRDRKLPGQAATSAARTFAKTNGAQASAREPRKMRRSVLPI